MKTDEIIAISDDSRDYLQACFLDWLNNFLTIEGYSSHYGLTDSEAETIINAGRRIHKERTE